MSAVNRLKKKKHVQQPPQQTKQAVEIEEPSPVQFGQKKKKIFAGDHHSQEKEKQYEMYYELSQSNPNGVTFSNTVFPNSSKLYRQFKMPLSIMTSPLLAMEAENCPMIEKNIDKIPRCGHCRCYMNCYNELKKKTFVCFVCGRENNMDSSYGKSENDRLEFSSSIYQALGSPTYYNVTPPQVVYTFLIDISPAAYESKMLYYAVASIKQALSSANLDDVGIYFYTYDEVLHQYDFSGQQTKCVIMDPTIQRSNQLNDMNYLENIREKLFQLLDDLEEMSKNNTKQGSNFMGCLKNVFDNTKRTGGKIFIFQSNEMIGGEAFTQEETKQSKNNPPQPPVKNTYETKNKTFFDVFVSEMLSNAVSMSLFVFQRTYKNLRVMSDVFKLTNSELKIYHKDNEDDLNKFYYDLTFLLNSTYCNDARMELIVSPGWNFNAVYGNLYRVKNFITFKFCHVESTRKVFICVNPQQNENVCILPYFALQMITNYFYKRQHYVSVATLIQPVTGYLERLYTDIEFQVCSAVAYRSHMSSLRLDAPAISKKKVLQTSSDVWKCALNFYKKKQHIPQAFMNYMLGILALLKSYHNQFQLITNSLYMDKIVAQRNELQGSGVAQVYTFWNPYLFNLATMDESMCRDDIQFAYPQVTQALFSNVKEGIFLLDCGLALYLFIAKKCSPELLTQLFGKSKIPKNEHLSEDNFAQTFFSSQVSVLIRTLRQQKSYGWIPLYIVRCGQGSQNEKNFYMNFYAQKYDEFRNYKISLNEFLVMLEQTQNF